MKIWSDHPLDVRATLLDEAMARSENPFIVHHSPLAGLPDVSEANQCDPNAGDAGDGITHCDSNDSNGVPAKSTMIAVGSTKSKVEVDNDIDHLW